MLSSSSIGNNTPNLNADKTQYRIHSGMHNRCSPSRLSCRACIVAFDLEFLHQPFDNCILPN